MSERDLMTNWDIVRGRVGTDPFFVGWVLKEYASANQISDDALANILGCSKRALTRLFLCRLPNDDGANFHSDIRRISGYTHCNADRLVMLIREVVATKNLGAPAEQKNGGLLLAARDRHEGDKDAGQDDGSDSK